jgi:hypothetical protein
MSLARREVRQVRTMILKRHAPGSEAAPSCLAQALPRARSSTTLSETNGMQVRTTSRRPMPHPGSHLLVSTTEVATARPALIV